MYHYSRLDFAGDPVLPILGVKVWKAMIAIVHLNDDAKESTDFRHDTKNRGWLYR
jgi:hypothetical protein